MQSISSIKNGKLTQQTGASGGAIWLNSIGSLAYLENVRINNTNSNGLYFASSPVGTSIVFMKNCMFDNCNQSNSYYAAINFSGANGPVVYDMDSKYGTITPNKKSNISIMRSGLARPYSNGSYKSSNCSYNTPTTSFGPTTPISAHWVTFIYEQIGYIGPPAAFEFNNPIINGVPADSGALIAGCGVLGIPILDPGAVWPPGLPVTSNIKMMVTPCDAIGRTNANIKMPILLNLTAGVAKTISVYLRTTVAQAQGRQPTLHIWGGGHSLTKEMSSTPDVWEKSSITFTPDYSGVVMCWVSCMNSLLVTASLDGTPSAFGTVLVYADGFEVV
jgi:hypothetical protein